MTGRAANAKSGRQHIEMQSRITFLCTRARYLGTLIARLFEGEKISSSLRYAPLGLWLWILVYLVRGRDGAGRGKGGSRLFLSLGLLVAYCTLRGIRPAVH